VAELGSTGALVHGNLRGVRLLLWRWGRRGAAVARARHMGKKELPIEMLGCIP